MNDSKKKSRNHQIPLRIDDDERAKLAAIAAMWGLSLSAAMRRLIREKKVRDDQAR
jgi:antitoxin component of RelBE/YafQ-DinJ toxin-antitoxin module